MMNSAMRRPALLACLLATSVSTVCIASDAAPQIGWITFDGPIVEKAGPLDWLTGASANSLDSFVAKFDDAEARADMPAVVLFLRDLQANSSQINVFRNEIRELQSAGKKVHVFSEDYGPAQMMLAAGADEVILQSGGYVSLPGIYVEEVFLADTLGLIGVRMQMVQVGDYKGASEMMGRNAPSPQWSENFDALLDDMWSYQCETISTGRGMDQARYQEVLKNAWSATAEEARSLGLVDTITSSLDLQELVQKQYGGAKITTRLGPDEANFKFDATNPFAMLAMLSQEPDHTPKRETIAVIHIDGQIVDGESSEGGFFGGGSSIGDRTIRKALKEIEDQELIKGVVLRIDSPGGSAEASEKMWQAIRRVATTKPVFVSVGTMAASGGYYLSVAGDQIFVDPTSIVGSIGVVGGKPVLGDLYGKLKVGVAPRVRGPMAELMGTVEPWDTAQEAAIRSMMEKIYVQFTDRVNEGRKGRVDLSKCAEGRLFTGRQAVQNGMADQIGDFEDTVESLASAAGLAPDTYDLMTYPGPMSLEDMAAQMAKGFGLMAPSAASKELNASPQAAAARSLLGDKVWAQIAISLDSALRLREEQVMLISPTVLVFK